MLTSNLNSPKLDEIYNNKQEEKNKELSIKLNNLIELAQKENSPQIIIDSFKNAYSANSTLNTSPDVLIKTANKCYEDQIELINKLPKELAESFIYAYSTYGNKKEEIVKEYSYCKGYKDVFYLLHVYGGVFIVYNDESLQKDEKKYSSDYSWGYIDLSGDDTYTEDKRVSGNTTQTAEVILKAVFPDNKEKQNLIQPFIDTFLIENTSYQTNSSFTKEDVLNWYDNLNLIKRVCIEQQLTYKEFGEKVGFGEGAIKNAAASGKISVQLNRAIEMYLEIQQLKQENKKFKKLQQLMKEIVSI